MSAGKVEKTRFTLLHMADFDAYKDEHVTLSPAEAEQNKQKRIVWPLNCYAVLVQPHPGQHPLRHRHRHGLGAALAHGAEGGLPHPSAVRPEGESGGAGPASG